jgi:hypothetical protein
MNYFGRKRKKSKYFMKRLSILLLAAILASACQKENAFSSAGSSMQLDGTYTGTYQITSPTATVQSIPITVQILVSGNNFKSGDLNIYHSVGEGSLKVNKDSIEFSNVDAFPGSGSFTNAGLSGNYNYTVKGDSLFLSKPENFNSCIYKLKKQ